MPAECEPSLEPSRWHLIAAFLAVYLIWGSTYLAIRVAIETIPPFLMAGVRFTLAGLGLYAWARARGARPPSRLHWRDGAVVGAFLLLGGNGGVVWAEQYVASGLAALLVATVPLWMVLFDWLFNRGPRPDLWLIVGLAGGLGGVVILAGAPGLGTDGPEAAIGGIVLLVAAMLWSAGSIYSRRAAVPARPRLGTAIQMITGGGLLIAAGLATGELSRLDLGAVSTDSAIAMLYLIVFGSILGFTAYIWLLRVTTAARASSYAYINPLVALALGWAFADEPVTGRTLIAAGVILGSVALITLRPPPPAARR